MIETTISVTRKTAADAAASATVSLGDVLLGDRAAAVGCRYQAAAAAADPGDDRQHLAGEAAHGGQQGGDQHDAEDDEVEDVKRA